MQQKIINLLQRPGIRYLLVGGSVYLFELLVIVLAEKGGASAIMAVALSFWLGLIVSFVLQKLVTFRDKRVQHKVLLPQILAVTALVIFNFLFTILVTKLLSDTMPAVVTRTIALGITTIWNFYLYRTRIFKTDENPVY